MSSSKHVRANNLLLYAKYMLLYSFTRDNDDATMTFNLTIKIQLNLILATIEIENFHFSNIYIFFSYLLIVKMYENYKCKRQMYNSRARIWNVCALYIYNLFLHRKYKVHYFRAEIYYICKVNATNWICVCVVLDSNHLNFEKYNTFDYYYCCIWWAPPRRPPQAYMNIAQLFRFAVEFICVVCIYV